MMIKKNGVPCSAVNAAYYHRPKFLQHPTIVTATMVTWLITTTTQDGLTLTQKCVLLKNVQLVYNILLISLTYVDIRDYSLNRYSPTLGCISKICT